MIEMREKLKKLRRSHGYTSAADFCAAAGLSFSTYKNYEAGTRLPTLELLVQIADFYGVSVDYLLGRAEPAPLDRTELRQQVAALADAVAALADAVAALQKKLDI